MDLRVELWDSGQWKEIYRVDMEGKINDGDYVDDVINYWNNAISDFIMKCTMFEGKKFQVIGPYYWPMKPSSEIVDNKQEEK